MAFKPFKILKGLLIKEENTNSPKQIEITPGGTAGTKTTVLSSQTTDKTLTLPDATDTLVGKATTDVLTNKSIDADTNTITNIENADIKAGAAIDATKIADGSVNNTEFQQIGGLSSPAVGESQSQTLSNKTIVVADNTITTLPSGNLTATELNAALAQLQSNLTDRASRSLNNLTGPTAINQTLAPSVHNAFSVGTSNEKFSNIWIDDAVKSNRYDVVASGAGSATSTGSLGSVATGPDGAAIGVAITNLGTTRSGLITNNDSNVDANPTRDIIVGTGNKTAGTGNSGSIKIRPGTSAGGTQGKILLEDGSLSGAALGHVWTLKNPATGEGSWDPVGGATTVIAERFNGNDSTVVFNLANDPITEENTQIYINGVYQQKNTYAVSGTAITFSEAPPTGTNNIEVTYYTAFAVSSLPDGIVTEPKIANNAVTTAKINNGAVTNAKLASLNIQISSITSYTNNTTSYTVAATVTITTSGRMCEWGIYHNSATLGSITLSSTSSVSNIGGRARIYDTGAATELSTVLFGPQIITPVSGYVHYPSLGTWGLLNLAAGTYTLNLEMRCNGASLSLQASTLNFFVREL